MQIRSAVFDVLHAEDWRKDRRGKAYRCILQARTQNPHMTKDNYIKTHSCLAVLHAPAWAKNSLWARPCVWLPRFSYELGKLHDPESLLKQNVATMGTEVTVGTQLCSNEKRSYCWNMLLQQWEPRSLLEHNCAVMRSEATVGTCCCNNANQGHCCKKLLKHWEPRSLLRRIVTMGHEVTVDS
jgi:hypothetical protein